MFISNPPPLAGNSGKQRKLPIQIASLLVATGFAALLFYLNRAFYHDDAFITLRYAANFIDGKGIVWNSGEYVQGYTNFLHLLLTSLLGAAGMDLVLATKLIGVTSFLATLSLIISFGRKTHRSTGTELWHLPVIFVATSSPIVVWSLGGLEGVLLSFLTTAAVLVFLDPDQETKSPSRFFGSGLLFSLGAMTRPDAVIFLAIAAAWLVRRVLLEKSPVSRRQLGGLLLGAALLLVPFVTWQAWYYGDIVPNTFYAKTGAPWFVSIPSGLSYVLQFIVQPPFLVALTAIALLYTRRRQKWDSRFTFLCLMIAGHFSYLVYIGGDHMESFRLMLPTIPLTSLLLFLSLKPIVKTRRETLILTAMFLLLAPLQIFDSNLNPQKMDRAAHVGTLVGQYIHNNWPSGSLVALNTAGSTPYYAPNLRFIDMLGLNDRVIAKRQVKEIQLEMQKVPGHLKGDGAYVVARKPDYIILGPAEGQSILHPWFLSDLELWQNAEFKQHYKLQSIILKDPSLPSELWNVFQFTYYQRIR